MFVCPGHWCFRIVYSSGLSVFDWHSKGSGFNPSISSLPVGVVVQDPTLQLLIDDTYIKSVLNEELMHPEAQKHKDPCYDSLLIKYYIGHIK